MKILKTIGLRGTVNHRDAYFGGALISPDKEYEAPAMVILSSSIHNPEDSESIEQAKLVVRGRIEKMHRLLMKHGIDALDKKRRILKYTEVIILPINGEKLISEDALRAITEAFKKIKERTLAADLGLKWNPKEGERITEISIEKSSERVAVAPNQESA